MNNTVPDSIAQGIPGFSGTAIDVMNIIKITDYLDVVALAIVAYDAVLTFEQETRLVWNGRWGVPMGIYLLNRYGIVFQAALNIIAVLDADLDGYACLEWNLFSNWSVPALILIIEIMLGFRVVALYGNDLRASIPIWTLLICSTAVTWTIMGLALTGAFSVPSPNAIVTGCQIGDDALNAYYWALWVPSLVFEVVMVLLTLGKALYNKTSLASTPLVKVLIRDGFMYFCVVFALMLVNLVIALTTVEFYYSLTPQISISVASVMCSRLFLNLRDTAYGPGHIATITGDVESHELYRFSGKDNASSALSSMPALE